MLKGFEVLFQAKPSLLIERFDLLIVPGASEQLLIIYPGVPGRIAAGPGLQPGLPTLGSDPHCGSA
jgi:hypothetical protein